MRTRRATLAALGGLGGAALAGCLFVDDPLEAAAEPAAVGEEALDETDFEHDKLTEGVREETVEVGDESQDLRLTNWTNRYTAPVEEVDIDAAWLSLFTTPTVSVAGRSVNPFDRLDRELLVEEMVERIDTGPVEDIGRVGEREVTVLEETVTVDEFEAQTETGIELRLHVGDRTHEGDLLVLFGLHPELLDRTDDLDTLFEGVVHPSERS